MHHAAVVVSWVAMIAAALLVAAGVITLTTHRVSPPRMRRRVSRRPYGWAQVCFGSFVLTNTAPRVAGASSGWALLLSIIALAPLVAAIVCMNRTQVHSHGGDPAQ